MEQFKNPAGLIYYDDDDDTSLIACYCDELLHILLLFYSYRTIPTTALLSVDHLLIQSVTVLHWTSLM